MAPVNEMQIEKQLDSELLPVKAMIKILKECTVTIKANAETIHFSKDEIIDIQFNPTEYSVSSQSSLENTKAKEHAKKVPKYKSVEADSLTVSFIYDAGVQLIRHLGNNNKEDLFGKFNKDGDLHANYLKKFRALTYVTEDGYPPYIKFRYGSFFFIGYATSVNIKCTRFHRNGKVLRAEIQLSMKQVGTEEKISINKEEATQPAQEEERYIYLDDLLHPK